MGEMLTGGYLVEIDNNYDETYKFKASVKQLPINLKSPDEEVPQEQLLYLSNFFCQLESILYDADFPNVSEKYSDYIDIDSFIDWWFVYELTQNSEPNQPKSCYMHKDRNGRLLAGPVWDFDWGTFKPINLKGFVLKQAIYYDALFKDPTFVNRVKEKWTAEKSDFESITNVIDSLSLEIERSAIYNCTLWTISNKYNRDTSLPFDKAVSKMRFTYMQRIKILNDLILDL